MATEITHNASTGEKITRTMSDAELRLQRGELSIIIENTNLALIDGEISEICGIQLQTRPLSGGEVENINRAETIRMQFGDEQHEIELNENGYWSEEITFVDKGTFVIKAIQLGSNAVTVEVTDGN